eukprot:TRINITY_DN6180_c0_g1_i1.p1 TRINITY_DN6180_c0_g1~~TRINITY_DN6180_c0_g1_i1.p1  ORF type:complete len:996 (-),score=261.58 TRINITY_DN6180_c0_g1_i1:19-3006(-)
MSKKREDSHEVERQMVMIFAQSRGEVFDVVEPVVKQGKKSENVFFCVGKYRFYLLSTLKKKATVVYEANFLEIQKITVLGDELTIETDREIKVTSDAPVEIASNIKGNLSRCFPGVDVFTVDSDVEIQVPQETDAPCKAFSAGYECVCDMEKVNIRADIAWDIDNIFPFNNITTFNLEEFEQPLHTNDIKALFNTLKYNKHFTILSLVNFKLDRAQFQTLVECLQFNTSIRKIVLKGCYDGTNEYIELFDALSSNNHSAVESIDISGNNIDDKVAPSFANWLTGINHGFTSLNIENLGFRKPAMVKILEAIAGNIHVTAELKNLNISGNRLEREGTDSLCRYLRGPNSLSTLNLADTSIVITSIFAAISDGSGCRELREINLSKNKITNRESIYQTCFFFSTTESCNNLKLNYIEYHDNQLEEMIKAILMNPHVNNTRLHLKGSNISLACIQAMTQTMCTHLTYLDLSDNEIGYTGITAFCNGAQYFPALEILILDNNVKTKGSDHAMMPEAIESLISLCNLNSIKMLSIQGSKGFQMGTHLNDFIQAIGNNDKLATLDISGQGFGDSGALCLGKALTTNDTLKKLRWDENETTFLGFTQFLNGLKRNTSLKDMELPLIDISKIMKEKDGTKIVPVMQEIQQVLERNHNPKSHFKVDNEFGEVSGHSLMSAFHREEIEKMIVQVKSTGLLKDDQEARDLINEANYFHEFVKELEKEKTIHFEKIMEEAKVNLTAALDQVVVGIHEMEADYRVAAKGIINQHCSHVEENARRRLAVAVGLIEKVNPEEVDKKLVKAAHGQLSDLVKESLDQVIAVASDYIFEQYIESLSDIASNLQNQAKKHRKSLAVPIDAIVVKDSSKKPRKASEKGTKTKPKRPEGAPDTPRKSNKKKDKEKDGKKKDKEKKKKRDSTNEGTERSNMPLPDLPPPRVVKPVERDPEVIELLDTSGPPANLDEEMPEPPTEILKSATATRAKVAATRRPPTRRPVRNNRPTQLG